MLMSKHPVSHHGDILSFLLQLIFDAACDVSEVRQRELFKLNGPQDAGMGLEHLQSLNNTHTEQRLKCWKLIKLISIKHPPALFLRRHICCDSPQLRHLNMCLLVMTQAIKSVSLLVYYSTSVIFIQFTMRGKYLSVCPFFRRFITAQSAFE